MEGCEERVLEERRVRGEENEGDEEMLEVNERVRGEKRVGGLRGQRQRCLTGWLNHQLARHPGVPGGRVTHVLHDLRDGLLLLALLEVSPALASS